MHFTIIFYFCFLNGHFVRCALKKIFFFQNQDVIRAERRSGSTYFTGCFLDAFIYLTKEAEKYVNEGSFVESLAVIIYI